MEKLAVVIVHYEKVLKPDDVWTSNNYMKADRSMTRYGAECNCASATGGGVLCYSSKVKGCERVRGLRLSWKRHSSSSSRVAAHHARALELSLEVLWARPWRADQSRSRIRRIRVIRSAAPPDGRLPGCGNQLNSKPPCSGL